MSVGLGPWGFGVLATWCSDLAQFVERCDGAVSLDRDLLEELFGLLTRGPAEICGPVIGTVTLTQIGSLAGAGCPDGAALLLAGNCGYMLSGAPGSLAIATIVPPHSGSEYSASGATLARAICGAIAGALLEASSQTANHADSAPLARRRYT